MQLKNRLDTILDVNSNIMNDRGEDYKLPYRFQDKERRIVITRHDLPSPWINYLSNGRLHAFVSQAGGGLAWWKTPTLFRLTRYRFYNLPIDSPGFYVYIRMADGSYWSPTFRPCETPLDQWEATHSPGYTTFVAQKGSLRAKLTFFVTLEEDALIWDLRLKNLSERQVDCDIFAYVEFSQLMYQSEINLGYYLKWQTRAEFDKDVDGIIYFHNASWVHPRNEDCPAVYFAASAEVTSYCCDRDKFCGNYHFEKNPIAVEKGFCDDSKLSGGEGCGALHIHQEIKVNEEKTVNFFLGMASNALKDYQEARSFAVQTLNKLRSDGEVERQFEKVKLWWNEHLSIYQCQIPDDSSQRQINIWNPLQCVHTARLSRSISSTASGIRGIGFRDTCQDMLAQAYRKPKWAEEMLLYLASLQFEEGHTVHQAWPEEKRLPQVVTRSDNHIWMVYLTYAIIAETGDLSLLDKEIPFLAEDLVSKASVATIWKHLMRGIEFTENHLGEHGLPLILFSDWNDHFGPFGRKGKGETVFVSQQHIYAMKLLATLAEKRKDTASVEKLNRLIAKQIDALSRYAWDGEWWLRGFDDDGNPVGTKNAKYARIWLNTQSWAVIAGLKDREKLIKGMDSAKKYLDTGIGLQINAPAFPDWIESKDGSVNGLPPGYSENAGVFCQANCWAIMAEALLGRADNAWKYYRELIPHEVIKKIGVEAYHAEPYAYASTLLGKDNQRHGWATVSQVTGTAAWMDVVSTQYLLGIRPVIDGLLIDPCIPSDWKGFSVIRKFRGCELHITVENPNDVQKGIKSLFFNGNPIEISAQAIINDEIIKDCKRANVKVVMG